MVLVSPHQLSHHGQVVGQQGGLEVVQSHARALVNDDDTIPVSKVHQLVSVGVVRGSVGVCSGPLDQVVVPGEQGQVQALPADVGVLVTTKPSDNSAR